MRDSWRPASSRRTGALRRKLKSRAAASSVIRSSTETWTPGALSLAGPRPRAMPLERASAEREGPSAIASGHRDALHDAVYRLVGGDPGRMRFVGEDQTMTENVMHDRLHVVGRYIVAALQPGIGARHA